MLDEHVRVGIPKYGRIACFFTSLTWTMGGCGFLNFPFVAWHGGIVCLLFTLVFFAFLATAQSAWMIETLARTEGIRRIELEKERKPVLGETPFQLPLSTCEIDSDQRLDMCDLVEDYFGRRVSVFVAVLIVVFCALSFWLNTLVVGTGLACTIPFGDYHSRFPVCTDQDFKQKLHPDNSCWNSYAISILIFSIVTSLLAIFEFGHLRKAQLVMGALRSALVLAIILYALVGSLSGNRRNKSESIPWTQSSWHGWLKTVSVCACFFMSQLAVPSLINPLKKKEKLVSLFGCCYLTAGLIYGIVGVTVAIFFGSDVNELASLNWVPLTGKEHSTGLRVLSYAIYLFPVLDFSWASLIVIGVMVDTVESRLTASVIVTSSDRAVLRVVAVFMSSIASVYITNVVVVAQLIAVVVVCLSGLLPAALQLRSRQVWKREVKEYGCVALGLRDTPYSSLFGHPYVVTSGIVFLLSIFALTITSVILL